MWLQCRDPCRCSTGTKHACYDATRSRPSGAAVIFVHHASPGSCRLALDLARGIQFMPAVDGEPDVSAGRQGAGQCCQYIAV